MRNNKKYHAYFIINIFLTFCSFAFVLTMWNINKTYLIEQNLQDTTSDFMTAGITGFIFGVIFMMTVMLSSLMAFIRLLIVSSSYASYIKHKKGSNVYSNVFVILVFKIITLFCYVLQISIFEAPLVKIFCLITSLIVIVFIILDFIFRHKIKLCNQSASDEIKDEVI